MVRRVASWPVSSQQGARRNAMLAATSCAHRRAERQEVSDFLADRYRDPTGGQSAEDAGSAATRRAH